MGIINVETRLSEQRIPADPANVDSREVIQQQAGQVGYRYISSQLQQSFFWCDVVISDFKKLLCSCHSLISLQLAAWNDVC
jgi:hypothetical protein